MLFQPTISRTRFEIFFTFQSIGFVFECCSIYLLHPRTISLGASCFSGIMLDKPFLKIFATASIICSRRFTSDDAYSPIHFQYQAHFASPRFSIGASDHLSRLWRDDVKTRLCHPCIVIIKPSHCHQKPTTRQRSPPKLLPHRLIKDKRKGKKVKTDTTVRFWIWILVLRREYLCYTFPAKNRRLCA